MTIQDRIEFKNVVLALCEEYGTWDVLWQFTNIIRPELKALDSPAARRAVDGLESATDSQPKST